MEYKKDTRTKNLTLREIHVGDWVQVWSEQAERYSPPLKIIQICDDGTIYLVTSDEERPTPWEEDIKNVDALPITRELLEGFGFEVTQRNREHEFDVRHGGRRICGFYEYNNCNKIETTWCSYEYFHKFMDYIFYVLPKKHKLEWKGIEKCDKTICCGECKKFLYEDIEGCGICDKTNEVCYCGDKCHLTHGKP